MTRPKAVLPITTIKTKVITRGNKKAKYTTTTSSRTVMPERGIDIEEIEQWLAEDIHAMNWEILVEPPAPAISEFVMEFLKLASEENFPLIKIKGIDVDFSAENINDCFNTEKVPEEEDDFISYRQKREDKATLEEIIKSICYEDAEWQQGGALDRRYLKYEAKVWMHFINSKLIPASHDSRVVWERAVLVFCILNKKKFNVGKIIHDELYNNLGLKKAPFYFPCMVSEICTRAGVKQENISKEEPIPRMNPINNSTLGRVRRNEETELAGSDEEEGTEQNSVQVKDGEESKGEGKEKVMEEAEQDSRMEGPKSEDAPEATPAKKAQKKTTAGKRKRIFEGQTSALVSQTPLGRGADMIVHSIQNTERLITEELQYLKEAVLKVDEEKVNLSQKLNDRLKKEVGHEEAALKSLVDSVSKMVKDHEEEKKEQADWKVEIQRIREEMAEIKKEELKVWSRVKEEMEETKQRELQLWSYIKRRDKINDQNWDTKFKTNNRIPDFPDILPPELLENAPQTGASSSLKQ